jgi:uncharacterized RDD family membrane protein YckC
MDEFTDITTPDHVALEFELAGPGSRFSAYLIDQILMGLLMLLVALIMIPLASVLELVSVTSGSSDLGDWLTSGSFAILVLVFFAILWGYYVFFEFIMRGRTPGKKQLSLCVVRADGLPITFRESALRNLVRAVDMFPLFIIGGLVHYFDRQGRRLGDMVAGTLVVRERFEEKLETASGAAWASRVERGLSRQAVTLPRGSISASQLSLIEQFCTRRHTLPPERREALALRVAEPLLSLLGEDRADLMRRPDRALRCEQLLLSVVEMARTATSAKPPMETRPKPATTSLF